MKWLMWLRNSSWWSITHEKVISWSLQTEVVSRHKNQFETLTITIHFWGICTLFYIFSHGYTFDHAHTADGEGEALSGGCTHRVGWTQMSQSWIINHDLESVESERYFLCRPRDISHEPVRLRSQIRARLRHSMHHVHTVQAVTFTLNVKSAIWS